MPDTKKPNNQNVSSEDLLNNPVDEEPIVEKDPEKFSRPTDKSKAPESVKQSDKTIMVDIRNRKEQFFRGEAKTVSSVNETGEFDVLPEHANFVTLIRAYVIVDKDLTTEKKFEIDSGVLAAKTDSVDVYLDF